MTWALTFITIKLSSAEGINADGIYGIDFVTKNRLLPILTEIFFQAQALWETWDVPLGEDPSGRPSGSEGPHDGLQKKEMVPDVQSPPLGKVSSIL